MGDPVPGHSYRTTTLNVCRGGQSGCTAATQCEYTHTVIMGNTHYQVNCEAAILPTPHHTWDAHEDVIGRKFFSICLHLFSDICELEKIALFSVSNYM